jgi:FMN phosphatase YigB (HAD superfamily)
MTDPKSPTLVFLLDVDNTLLDNDRLKDDLQREIRESLGPERADRFWQIYEEVRAELDCVDYPKTIERMAAEYGNPIMREQLEQLLYRIDFKSYLYPRVMDAIARMKSFGTVVILSDGDSVFQPEKIKRSGLEAATDGNVLIYVHKENELAHVFERYPADHYVMVDDKPRITAALERMCPGTFTTILVLQGKYAQSAGEYSPKPDIVIERIGGLRTFGREQFLASARADMAPS